MAPNTEVKHGYDDIQVLEWYIITVAMDKTTKVMGKFTSPQVKIQSLRGFYEIFE